MKTLINRQLWLPVCVCLCALFSSWTFPVPTLSKPFASLLASLPESANAGVDDAAVSRVMTAAKKYYAWYAKRASISGSHYAFYSQGPGMERPYSYDILLDGVSIVSGPLLPDSSPHGAFGTILSAGDLRVVITPDYGWDASGFIWIELVVDNQLKIGIGSPIYVNAANTPTGTAVYDQTFSVSNGSEFSLSIGSGQDAP